MKRAMYPILAAVLVLGALFAAHTFNRESENTQAQQYQQEKIKEYREATPKKKGSTKAILTVPTFGKNYAMPIIDGVSQRVLDSGVVGHFPGTGPLGVGNYALTAHVVTHGEPFAQLPNIRKGDEVVVEKGGTKYAFVIHDIFVVDHTQVSVLDYQPKTITLITCNSRVVRTDERLVVVGRLKE